MSLPFGRPQTVSPLIRGLRYGLLIAGIFYGRYKQAKYEELEDIWREEEAERKVLRDRELKKLKARIAKEEREVVRQIETGEYFKIEEVKPEEPEPEPKPKRKECRSY
ncbi:PREDICTED: uncharacterized protein LOC106115736 [Papilio xuthus]|uniref:ATP synthase F(0) complex subunit e, mitochondrial n=1 Tax=Papilio xuthus TaxID=66420 RepID=A0A194QBU3_PAPXU|nr:PREDICTED: uncharacterized protein LOC106115736 [Papilio xuthus]KPJ02932.1 hypothetical protein RR46_02859 [Papilio xuthus]